MSQTTCDALERVRREDPERFEAFLADRNFDFGGHLRSCRECANFYRSARLVETTLKKVYSDSPPVGIDVRKNTARILERAYGADERRAGVDRIGAFLDLLLGMPFRKLAFAAMPAVLLLACTAFYFMQDGRVERHAGGTAGPVAVGGDTGRGGDGRSVASNASNVAAAIPFEFGTYALSPDARITPGNGKLSVESGTVSFAFEKSERLSTEGFLIQSPHVRIAIKGTALEVSVKKDATAVTVTEGRVEVTEAPGGKPFTTAVSKGERLVAGPETVTRYLADQTHERIGTGGDRKADTVESMIRSGAPRPVETKAAPTEPPEPPVTSAPPAPTVPVTPFTTGDGMK